MLNAYADIGNSEIKTTEDFIDQALMNGFTNENCDISNHSLVENDLKLSNKMENLLKSFGGLKLSDFDMGQCLSRESITNHILITIFWQKNKSFKDNSLNLFVAYNPYRDKLLLVILDEDGQSYFLGDNDQYMRSKFSENPETKDQAILYYGSSNRTYKDFEEDIKSKSERGASVHEYNSSFDDWHITCKRDRFDGTKMCLMLKRNEDVSVMIMNGKYHVFVGRDHYPRTQSAIKIDNNATIYGYEGVFKNSPEIIEQMKRGRVVYSRYKEWPYDYNKDNEMSLLGFTEKYNEMRAKYREL